MSADRTAPAAPAPALTDRPARALRDQPARDRIVRDTGATLFVNAGAGSGKTRALVDRITTLVLTDGVPMAHIAAVTFTEKAGAELRDRLRSSFNAEWRKIARPGGEAADGESAGGQTADGEAADGQDPSGKGGHDPIRHDRAVTALDELDRAAVGTLHSFAQRILTEHAVAAGLPPLVEVMDEVASSVSFDDRWAQMRTALLDDEQMEAPLLLGMAAGLTLDHVHSLARTLGSDWDLIDERILIRPPAPVVVPDTAGLLRQARDVLDLAQHCTDPEDKLLPRFAVLTSAVEALQGAIDDGAKVTALQQLTTVKFSYGKQANWQPLDVKEVRAAGNAVAEAAADLIARVLDRCLRAVTYWTARRVLDSAVERRRDGRLEFHDLLVLARDLLRHNAEVRATLHQTYQRLLLDEFQDTDPIQIELAVRIAGGAAADAPDWTDVKVPDGRLFVVGDAKQSIYRFRRADIGMYLGAQEHLGTGASLTTNFRTVDPILTWVNAVFSQLISFEPGRQPPYEALDSYRLAVADSGPSVTVLGADPHEADAQPEGKLNADRLRTLEADDVAATIGVMLTEGWRVQAGDGTWRAVQPADIAILVPARTSLSYLEQALAGAGVPYRAEASSLVYQAAEVRALLACARAIADFSDELSLVTALRSPLFGCGDDDLWEWKRHGRRFTLRWQPDDDVPEVVRSSPVAAGLAALRAIARRARWSTPSAVLEGIITERRMFEVAATGADRRDVWRRLRFVVDQARAWSQVTHGGLRAYLAWAAHQGDEASRVSESVLPETDVDAVHISTIHGAKGLEYPVVLMSGMTSQPRNRRGVQLLWPPDGGYAVRLSSQLQTSDFTAALPVDEQMDDAERMRLLYVAATRARDHLVVSLHRGATSKTATAAKLLADAGATTGAVPLEDLDAPPSSVPGRPDAQMVPPPPWQVWSEQIERAQARTDQDAATVASGLEGTEPSVVLTDADPGSHKGQRDLVLPPWSKGRYGSAIGRAVHGVLQSADLGALEVPAAAVDAQCVAEGVTAHREMVADLVRSALGSPVVRTAAARRHWRETYVGTTDEDGSILEGYVDLIYEDHESDGLVIVDYKTDAVPAGALASRVTYYQPQMQAYATCLARATGRAVRCVLLFLHPEGAYARDAPVTRW